MVIVLMTEKFYTIPQIENRANSQSLIISIYVSLNVATTTFQLTGRCRRVYYDIVKCVKGRSCVKITIVMLIKCPVSTADSMHVVCQWPVSTADNLQLVYQSCMVPIYC